MSLMVSNNLLKDIGIKVTQAYSAGRMFDVYLVPDGSHVKHKLIAVTHKLDEKGMNLEIHIVHKICCKLRTWKGGRVVYYGSLENCWTSKGVPKVRILPLPQFDNGEFY